MEDALNRYEKELLESEKDQQMHRENLQKAHNNDIKYIQDEKLKRQRDMEENRLFLKLQMEENKYRKDQETQ